MGLKDLVIIAALVAGGYWFYTNHLQDARSLQELRWQENADLMAECIKSERRIARLHGNAGQVADESQSGAELACADRYDLYFEEGRWYSRQP